MRALGLFGLVALAAGCGTTPATEGPRSSGEKGNYVILDESERFWIVKVWKRGGSPRRTAGALRGGSPAEERKGETRTDGPDTNCVRGRISRGKAGVAGCKVKLTPMRRNLGVLQWEESYGVEPSGLTDSAGNFEIRGVSEGAYRLKWFVPGDSGWVKRLKERPDVVVEAGKVAEAADVDVSRRAR